MKRYFFLISVLLLTTHIVAQDFWQPVYGVPGVIHAISVNPSGHIFVGTAGHGAFRSTDNGATFTEINNGLPITFEYSLNTIHASPNGVLLASFYHSSGFPTVVVKGLKYRSTNNGDSWLPVEIADSSKQVWKFYTLANGTILAGMDEATMMRSTDNGVSWEGCSIGLQQYEQIKSFHERADGTIFAGGLVDFYKSTNNGDSWMSTLANLNLPWTLDIAENGSGDLFIGVWNNSPNVFRSSNNGMYWDTLQVPINVSSIAVNSAGHVFAGTYLNGVWYSSDNGNNWSVINSGLGNDGWVYDLTADKSGYLYAGLKLNGIAATSLYRTSQPVMSADEVSITPDGFHLRQNYPNPFNPETTVLFSLDAPGDVRVEVYNLLGQKVATLVDGYVTQGNHQALFNAQGFPSGTYFCRITVNNRTQAISMTLLR